MTNFASQIFFTFGSLLEILICGETDLKKSGLPPNVSVYILDYRNPAASTDPVCKHLKEYQSEMK